jgi:hypothetical protein
MDYWNIEMSLRHKIKQDENNKLHFSQLWTNLCLIQAIEMKMWVKDK